jgi:hypothetical protein
MFAVEPPPSSDSTKAAFVGFDEATIFHGTTSPRSALRRLLLQIGGANIADADRAW